MKRKYFTYILLVVVSLFVFNSRVEADEKDGYGVSCSDITFGSDYKIFNTKDYDANCIYNFETDGGSCVIFQFSYKFNKGEAKNIKFKSLSNDWTEGYFPLESDIDKSKLSGICPTVVGIFYAASYTAGKAEDSSASKVNLSDDKNNAKQAYLVNSIYSSSNTAASKIGSDDVKIESLKSLSCAEVLYGKDGQLLDIIQGIVNVIKLVVPVLLIVFGILDFGKAIFSFDEGEMKKAQTRFMKRIIIGIAFFLIPTFLGIILNIAHNIWPFIDNSLCGIKF